MQIPFGILFLQRYLLVSAAFPQYTQTQMKTFLQTPEKWGAGPVLFFGIPRPNLAHPCHILTDPLAKSIDFTLFNHPATLVCNWEGDRIDVCIQNIGTMQARIDRLYSDQSGCVVNLILQDASGNWLHRQPPVVLKMLLDAFLWNVDATYQAKLDPVLERFRKLRPGI